MVGVFVHDVRRGSTYPIVVKQFTATWQGTAPSIQRVCKVVNTKAVEARYQKYRCALVGLPPTSLSGLIAMAVNRQTVESAGDFKKQGKTAGNGTSADCGQWRLSDPSSQNYADGMAPAEHVA